MTFSSRCGTAAVAIVGCLTLAAPAAASQTVTASGAVARSCHRDVTSSASGRDLVRETARSRSIISARLKSRGDWDVAIFGTKGRLVAESAPPRGEEGPPGGV